MRLMNVTGRVMMAAMLVVSLSACGKKKNGGAAVAATPGTSCTYNEATGQYVNTAGAACTPKTIICPSSGIYNGQVCTPGQAVYPVNPGYPNQTPYPNQAYGCHAHTLTWGIEYVPVLLGNQYQCVRIDLLEGYSYNTNYYEYGYDYYYAYPPYQDDNNNDCTQIDFGGSWGYVGICF